MAEPEDDMVALEEWHSLVTLQVSRQNVCSQLKSSSSLCFNDECIYDHVITSPFNSFEQLEIAKNYFMCVF
jgi:hypothetical protein